MTRLQQTLTRLAPILFLAGLALVVAACVPGSHPGSPGASPSYSQAPLHPAQPGANPIDLLAWLFTPIFQTLFIGLVLLEQLFGNMVFAIITLTIILRILVIPLYRRQLTSTRQMQLLQPEIKEIQRRYKGDSVKARVAQQELFKERGINPLSG